MSKKVVLKIIIYLFLSCIFCMDAYGQDIIQDKNYKNTKYEFEKLTESEILVFLNTDVSVNGENQKALIVRDTVSKSERLLEYWNINEGGYQLSSDRKTGIIFLTSQIPPFYPLFFIDGRNGTIRYLMNMRIGARTSSDSKYLLVNTDLEETGLFNLIDINNSKIIKTLKWDIKKKQVGAMFIIYRSLDREYDFRIDYECEGDLIASCYYKIGNNNVNIIFDYSDLSYTTWLERRKIKKSEVGRPD